MGNVNQSAKGVKPIGCNPLTATSAEQAVQHQNDLNANKTKGDKYFGQKILDSKNGNVQKNIRCNSITSEAEQKSIIARPSSDRARPTSPASIIGLGVENIRLTADVNNSRPQSRSSTPVLTRKACIRDYPTSSPAHHQASVPAMPAVDQHRSSSNSSLKDSQAKDIMISYSHLDKEIMMKLKGKHKLLQQRKKIFGGRESRSGCRPILKNRST